MLIGYARVSTHDQNLDLQEDALTSAGREKIFVDELGGAAATARKASICGNSMTAPCRHAYGSLH